MPRDVTHIDVVSCVGPVAEHPGGATPEQVLGEDRHDAGLPVRILSRAVQKLIWSPASCRFVILPRLRSSTTVMS